MSAAMNLYDATIPVFLNFLKNVNGWLDKTIAFAEAKKFDPDTLLTARLAPDQFPLVRQIQSICDQMKLGAARLTGKQPPSHPDTEKTIAELRERIAKVAAYLETYTKEDFVGVEDRDVTSPAIGGKTMRGGDYLDYFILPNMHFHLTTAYAILRHNGVELGKRDYLGRLPLKG